jgi:hypothetical protein
MELDIEHLDRTKSMTSVDAWLRTCHCLGVTAKWTAMREVGKAGESTQDEHHPKTKRL